MDDVQIKPLKKVIDLLFTKTIEMCVKSGMIKDEEMEEINTILKENNLTPQDIEDDCTTELKNLCLYEYKEVTQGSNRFNGKGYSSYKIEENMKIFLKEKLTKFASLISLKKQIKPASLEKSFISTIHEIVLNNG
jgi:hypothetical protein